MTWRERVFGKDAEWMVRKIMGRPRWIKTRHNDNIKIIEGKDRNGQSLPSLYTHILNTGSHCCNRAIVLYYLPYNFKISHEVSLLLSSHPSDYMNNYEDSLSSDSSNPTIKITIQPKNKPSLSLHQPSHTRSHTHKLPKDHKKPAKK